MSSKTPNNYIRLISSVLLFLKSRILFKDKQRKWEEIESKVQAEHDSLLLRSSNKVKNLFTSAEVEKTGWSTTKDPPASWRFVTCDLCKYESCSGSGLDVHHQCESLTPSC